LIRDRDVLFRAGNDVVLLAVQLERRRHRADR
jgi:hypothetical protein